MAYETDPRANNPNSAQNQRLANPVPGPHPTDYPPDRTDLVFLALVAARYYLLKNRLPQHARVIDDLIQQHGCDNNPDSANGTLTALCDTYIYG